MVAPRVAVAGAALALAGCSLVTDSFLTNDFSGDAYPIDVDTSAGAVAIGLRPGADADRPAILDLLAPFTVVDSGTAARPRVTSADLTLLGAAGPGGPLTRPRARFPGAAILNLHPCQDADCAVGPAGATRPFEAILGADALAGDAIRLHLAPARPQLYVLPDIGGDDDARARACDAVFSSPYRGGGTLVVDGTELPFGNRRITVRACVAPVLDPQMLLPQGQRGTDALLVVSTGVGITLLSEAAYQRYVDSHRAAAPPPVGNLPEATVVLASGPVRGRRTTVPAIALVGASAGNPLAPCRHVYAHHVLAEHQLLAPQCQASSTGPSLLDCPCKNGATFCAIPSIVELTPAAGIDVLVVPDTEPTLQALRTELRPDQPEIDGVLGTGALGAVELDIDYPHDRMLGRCTDSTCATRPRMNVEDDRCLVNQCLTGVVSALGCGDNPAPPYGVATTRAR